MYGPYRTGIIQVASYNFSVAKGKTVWRRWVVLRYLGLFPVVRAESQLHVVNSLLECPDGPVCVLGLVVQRLDLPCPWYSQEESCLNPLKK